MQPALSYDEILRLKVEILEKTKRDEMGVEAAALAVVDQMDALSTRTKAMLVRTLLTEIHGYGAIQPYLDDRRISEIMINGMGAFFVERNGCIQAETHPFQSLAQLNQLIFRVAAEVGREVNQAHPLLDARLQDGSRVNIILPPIALHGPIITIRKFNSLFCGESEMIQTGMLNQALSDFLKTIVAARYNLFICGGTGSGKTTLLNYLCQAIEHGERVITIEDAAEIDISSHPHVISLETKQASQKDYRVGMSRLIKNALRMRPDRIIVGEVRGEEVLDMLQAMNTGHDGSISTGHANSAMDMLVRLEVIAANHSDIDVELVRKQLISAIDILVYVERYPNGRRVIRDVFELEQAEDSYRLRPIFSFDEDRDTTAHEMESRLLGRRKLLRYRDRSRSNPL